MNDEDLSDSVRELSAKAVSGDLASQSSLLHCLRTHDAALKPFYEMLERIHPVLTTTSSSLPSLPSISEANPSTLSSIFQGTKNDLPIRVRFSLDDLYNFLLFLAFHVSNRIFLPIRLIFSASSFILIECHHISTFILLPPDLLLRPSSLLICSQFLSDHTKNSAILPHALHRVFTTLLTSPSSTHQQYSFLDPWLPSNLFDNTDDIPPLAFSVEYLCKHLHELQWFTPYHPDVMTLSSHYLICLVKLQLISGNLFSKICLICFMVLSGKSLALCPAYALNIVHICLGDFQEMWSSVLSVEVIQDLCSATASGNYELCLRLFSQSNQSLPAHDSLVLLRLIASGVTFRMMNLLDDGTAEVAALFTQLIGHLDHEDSVPLSRLSLMSLVEECEFVNHASSFSFLTRSCKRFVSVESLCSRWRRILEKYLYEEDVNYLKPDDIADIKLRLKVLDSHHTL